MRQRRAACGSAVLPDASLQFTPKALYNRGLWARIRRAEPADGRSRLATESFKATSASIGDGEAVVPSPAVAALFADIAARGPVAGAKGGRGPAWLLTYGLAVRRRRRFMKLYGWSVPTPAAIGAIAAFLAGRQLLEVGAGNGLWARLLNAYGVAVTATDDLSWAAPDGSLAGEQAPPPSGFAVDAGRFYPVDRRDALDAVKKYTDHQALLICWPSYGKAFAAEALAAFRGDRVVYVGDPSCTADADFHDRLLRLWLRKEIIAVPTWPTIHDAVHLYERKEQRWAPRNADRPPNPHMLPPS